MLILTSLPASPLLLPATSPLVKFTLNMLWASSKNQVSSQMDSRRGAVVSYRPADARPAKAEARQKSVEVTGVVLSQGVCEAVRAMSNVKVLCLNGDVKSSEETLLKTMFAPPLLAHTLSRPTISHMFYAQIAASVPQ